FGEVPDKLRGCEQVVVPRRRRGIPRSQRAIPISQEHRPAHRQAHGHPVQGPGHDSIPVPGTGLAPAHADFARHRTDFGVSRSELEAVMVTRIAMSDLPRPVYVYNRERPTRRRKMTLCESVRVHVRRSEGRTAPTDTRQNGVAEPAPRLQIAWLATPA